MPQARLSSLVPHILFVLSIIVTASACSATDRLAVTMTSWPCVTDTEADWILPMLEPSVDRGASTPDPWELTSRHCRSRIYTRNGTDVEVVRSGWWSIEANALPPGLPRTPQQVTACLDESSSLVSRMHLADGEQVLQTYRARFPKLWNDPLRGPAQWVDCAHNASGGGSVAPLLHEATHSLTQKNCLFVPGTSIYTCLVFSDRKALPSATVLTMDAMPDVDLAQMRALSALAQTYQYVWKESDFPFELFDELNAYTMTAEAMAAELRTSGAPGLTPQASTALPLFMVYTLKYLASVKAQNPDLFQREFAPGTANRKVIDLLLERAEAAQRTWLTDLKRADRVEPQAERDLWNRYLVLKSAEA